jgi:hypothetical protein
MRNALLLSSDCPLFPLPFMPKLQCREFSSSFCPRTSFPSSSLSRSLGPLFYYSLFPSLSPWPACQLSFLLLFSFTSRLIRRPPVILSAALFLLNTPSKNVFHQLRGKASKYTSSQIRGDRYFPCSGSFAILQCLLSPFDWILDTFLRPSRQD